MDLLKHSLKDWEDALNDFRFLFRHEQELLAGGFYTESEFLEAFFEAVEHAAKRMRKRNES